MKFVYRRIAAVAVLVLVIALGLTFKSQIRAGFESIFGGADFAGPGSGTVSLTIEPGEDGSSIAHALADAGVVKDYSFTYKLMIRRNDVYIPGTFSMLKEMRSSDALDRLTSEKYLIVNRVTIKEGLRLKQVFAALSDATNIPVSDFEAVKPSQLGLSSKWPSIEGYLFPATYSFDRGLTAVQVLQIMKDRMDAELADLGVSRVSALKVLTLASIIQKEARQTNDFYKVSRVFTNRLQIGMHLQSDATVSYGSGGTTVTTTDAERADNNGYNTYVHAGLPIGPISAPGRTAIDAALHPVAGSWLFFCAVNLETGETVFSTTVAEHERAVAKWRAWMAQNPGWNG